jgi:hypothetical protein
MLPFLLVKKPGGTMIKISINGKAQSRAFQNMAQALAFAYQNGDCYGAKVVELAQEGAGSNGGPGAVGGFTQAEVDAACEKYCKEANEQLISQFEALSADNKAKEAEIAELKAKIESAVEGACDDVAKAANDEIVALEEQVKAKDAEIEKLKELLGEMIETVPTKEDVDGSKAVKNADPANASATTGQGDIF